MTWLLAYRYVARHRFKTVVLVLGLVLTACVPIATQVLLRDFQSRLSARANATPLVLGAPGSRFDLALHALYFEATVPRTLPFAEVDRVRDTGWAEAIPLHVRFTARTFPLVGTSLAYFEFRGLRIAEGSSLTRLGDCVLGSRVAAKLGLGPGDVLRTDSVNFIDIADVYPLQMRVVGTLAPTGTADDFAVFCDVKTAWIVEGIGHGHDDLDTAGRPGVTTRRDDGTVVANAALEQFREVTDANVASFHFHGEPEDLPITAVVAVPRDEKSATLLAGRYAGDDATAQLIDPAETIDELVGMVFEIKRFYDANTLLVGVATLLFLALVILLSLRLRAAERRTMFKIGCSRWTIVKLQLAELAIVFAIAAVVVAVLVGLVSWFSADLLRWILFG
jgi:putative ABC transport system permease protein